jgi:molybdopterin molybdotransferase
MVSVAQATDLVFSNLFAAGTERVPLAQAVDRVLTENVVADRDFPPFNRVAMDGIAISYAAYAGGQRAFPLAGVQAAGQPGGVLDNRGKALEVMTGAPMPEGADTVIRYEDLAIANGVATVQGQGVKSFDNIHRQGSDAHAKAVLLEPGQRLSPAEIALLASVGKAVVQVRRFPKAAIISSGDELVSVNETPELYQIRRSNSHALEAAMRQLGWKGDQYHLRDEQAGMTRALQKIVDDYEVLIISGGVSKGKFDFIPAALEAIGVKKLFHQVNQRPGKPFWFGRSPQGKIVFALPGNPVSTYMCFYRYITPWLWKSLGTPVPPATAVLGQDFSFEPPLTYFLQVSVKLEQGQLVAYPRTGGGSGDFANLKNADGFLELPHDRTMFKAGEAYPLYLFRSTGCLA